MPQAQYSPFKALIDAARSNAQALVEGAQSLAQSSPASFANYLIEQQNRAAEIERQIHILERMSAFFSEASV